MKITNKEFVSEKVINSVEYNIPTYAVNLICKLILDPNDELDYYDIPDTFALNQLNRDVELNDEEVKNINEFVEMLNARFHSYTIEWDIDSCESPQFELRPVFGLPMDCVILRVSSDNGLQKL